MNNTTTNNNNISNSNVKRTSYRGRSRSNSPASSVDSVNRRRLTTNLNSSTKKKSTGRASSGTKGAKQNVQVFTSLPPKVESDIKCYLKLQITKVVVLKDWWKKAPATNGRKLTGEVDAGQNLIARCLWWGEENSRGALFRPKVVRSTTGNSSSSSNAHLLQTTARYMIRSGPKQFTAYLNDMKTLDIDLIDESTMQIISRVQIYEIGQLTATKPIKGVFSAYDLSQLKIADVHVSIKIESIQDATDANKRSSDQSMLSDANSRPTTPSFTPDDYLTRKANDTFDKQWAPERQRPSLFTENSNLNSKFELDADVASNHKNPILDNLIKRGLKLKSEMLKTTIHHEDRLSNNDILNNSSNDLISLLNRRASATLPDDEISHSFGGGGGHDDSRLSDPMHDPDYYPLLADRNNSNIGEDRELKELLEPSDLFTRLINNNKPMSRSPPNRDVKFTMRSRTASRSSLSSNDGASDVELDARNSSTRVSFELQSSDGENSSVATGSDNYLDHLSPQRISLLNLVQVAKLKVEKLILQAKTTASLLIEQSLNRAESAVPITNSKSKPPLAKKITAADQPDLNQLLFVEYQFPVVANSRDEPNRPSMATQAMRVPSKRAGKHKHSQDDFITFEHACDYTVVFNSHSIESWWRSAIVFKIYIRSGKQPVQVGIARLALRNVLKSRNFKLYKKLAVRESQSSSSNAKRIGTLHVSVELTSDLREFLTNLAKLKTINEQALLPVRPALTRTEIVPKIATPAVVETKPQEEFSHPIQMFLSINEGRGFSANNLDQLASIYLICRLFWNKEKVRFETREKAGQFCWTLNLSFQLKQSIVDNMRNNFMVIEAWQKGDKDSLIGMIKLPLHEFWLKFNDVKTLRSFLVDSTMPLVGVEGWVSAFDPFTGQRTGEINTLLALGSNQQIINLQKILFDKARRSTGAKSPARQPAAELIEHIFTFLIDNIKLQLVSNEGGDVVYDETNFFIKYSFPTTQIVDQDRRRRLKHFFSTYFISSKLNTNLVNKLEHRIVLDEDANVAVHLNTLFRNEFQSQRVDCGTIQFELWCKAYFPNVRERLIAVGELPLDKLLHLVNAHSNRDRHIGTFNSFIVPLVDASNQTAHNGLKRSDRYLGQLFLNVNYKQETLSDYNQPLNVDESMNYLVPYKTKDESADFVTMNIGVLRAYGLEQAVSGFIKKNSSALVNLENSNLYVKFSLGFLNRLQDVRQTRLVSSMLCGYAPEFFSYFDVKCALTSTYNTSTKRTMSLAEQLECGQITFEVWSKFIDEYEKNTTETLLGTCVVRLDALLESRIGIRGWLPIRPVNSSNTSLLSSLVDERNARSSAGSIEVAIRFCKTDDYLKIINSARNIGWVRSNDFSTLNKQSMTSEPQMAVQPVADTTSEPHLHTPKKNVKCLIEIEKAVHLASIYDQKLNRHSAPNAYVSFNASLENPNATIQTKICEAQISPVWNYQLLIQVNSDYFLDEGKYFQLKVCHKSSTGDDAVRILGLVSIDLQPLICGLSHISGWYNIQDSVGNCQGQLKVNILPQESMFWLKELYAKRKKVNQPPPPTSLRPLNSNNSNTSFCSTSQTSFVTSIPSYDHSQLDNNHSELKSGLLQKLQELENLNKTLKERLESNHRKKFADMETLTSELENGARLRSTQDEPRVDVNILSKDRTNRTRPMQPSPPVSLKQSTSSSSSSASSATPPKSPIVSAFKLQHRDSSSSSTTRSTYELEQKIASFRPTLELNNNSHHHTQNRHGVNGAETTPTVADSFWAQSDTSQIQVNDKLDTVQSVASENIHNSSSTASSRGKTNTRQGLNEFLKQTSIKSDNENESDVEKVDEDQIKRNENQELSLNNKSKTNKSNWLAKSHDTNDTELDQTFNLNESFEIPAENNDNSENQTDRRSFVFNDSNEPPPVDNLIIDCAEIDKNSDDDDDENDPLAQNRNKTTTGNEEVSLFIPNNVRVIKAFNDNDRSDEDDNDENSVIPEELNLIDDKKSTNQPSVTLHPNKTNGKVDESSSDSEENLFNHNDKIPNYFLPPQDLEKTMKRLHYNYTNIGNVNGKQGEQNGDETDSDTQQAQSEQNLKLKLKSTTLLIQNQNLLKQDLNRINKIFHTKFN